MDPDSWTLLAASSSRHHQPTIQSVIDAYLGFEEAEDEARSEFACPFCAEEFDLFGLCCHIDDEHPVEAKNGVCPICAVTVGLDLVGHITTQHGNYSKMQRRRRFHRSSSGTGTISYTLFKKELREGHYRSLYGDSSFSTPPSTVAPDPLLSSFIYNSTPPKLSKDVESQSVEDSLDNLSTDEKIVESPEPSLSAKDQKERAQRSSFVQDLLLSTLFEDYL